MDRVSSNLANDNMQYFTRQRQVDMNDLQSRISSQSRILNLRDDPAAAAHASRYASFNTRLETYSANIQQANDIYKSTETQMRSALDLVQKVRELAIQGANGTYSPDELKMMAAEVDQYLQQMVQLANSRDADGTFMFAGLRSKNTPFRTLEGRVDGNGTSVITGVEYLGDIGKRPAEIADNQYIDTTFPGNQVFWAENMSVYAGRDATSYVLTSDASISIDDQVIDLKAGDNIHSIISRINNSPAAVKAKLDPDTSGLVLETTTPHQIWLRDESGSVLKDLGVLGQKPANPPHNLSRDAKQYGGSVFDTLINLRDNLYAGDQKDIGSNVIKGLDSSLDNLLSNLGSLGAKSSRMDLAFKTTEKLLPDYQARISRELDVDITKSITDYKVLELTHQAALSTAAKIMKTTLLDFLR